MERYKPAPPKRSRGRPPKNKSDRLKPFCYGFDEIPVVVDPPYIAWLFKVSVETVRLLCRNGNLPSFMVGKQYRIKKADLMRFMQEGLVSIDGKAGELT